ncbi:MAG: hypothetical protein IJK23_13855 [Clostridia bacterium]|nr:hypothetical protein [Clostridia bacterium]
MKTLLRADLARFLHAGRRKAFIAFTAAAFVFSVVSPMIGWNRWYFYHPVGFIDSSQIAEYPDAGSCGISDNTFIWVAAFLFFCFCCIGFISSDHVDDKKRAGYSPSQICFCQLAAVLIPAAACSLLLFGTNAALNQIFGGDFLLTGLLYNALCRILLISYSVGIAYVIGMFCRRRTSFAVLVLLLCILFSIGFLCTIEKSGHTFDELAELTDGGVLTFDGWNTAETNPLTEAGFYLSTFYLFLWNTGFDTAEEAPLILIPVGVLVLSFTAGVFALKRKGSGRRA